MGYILIYKVSFNNHIHMILLVSYWNYRERTDCEHVYVVYEKAKMSWVKLLNDLVSKLTKLICPSKRCNMEELNVQFQILKQIWTLKMIWMYNLMMKRWYMRYSMILSFFLKMSRAFPCGPYWLCDELLQWLIYPNSSCMHEVKPRSRIMYSFCDKIRGRISKEGFMMQTSESLY